jgi:hypothetical protein
MNPRKMRDYVTAGGLSVRDVKTTDTRTRPRNSIQWGRSKQTLGTTGGERWDLGGIKPILTLDPEQVMRPGRNPQTLALALHTVQQRADTGVYALRWALEFGVGGAKTTFLIDAPGAQLITVPADMLRVSLTTELLDSTALAATYNPPSRPIRAAAFFAEGTTSTQPPTYTQGFSIQPAGFATLFIPTGASGFKLAGAQPAGANSPFLATTTLTLSPMPGGTLDQFLGDALIPFRNSMVPIPGMSGFMTIINGAAGLIQGSIIWEIDL